MSSYTRPDWTEEEIKHLLHLGRNGLSWEAMAEMHSRKTRKETIRRRWRAFSCPEDRAERQRNMRPRTIVVTHPDEKPRIFWEFLPETARFPDEPKAAKSNYRRLPSRAETWVHAESTAAWAVVR